MLLNCPSKVGIVPWPRIRRTLLEKWDPKQKDKLWSSLRLGLDSLRALANCRVPQHSDFPVRVAGCFSDRLLGTLPRYSALPDKRLLAAVTATTAKNRLRQKMEPHKSQEPTSGNSGTNRHWLLRKYSFLFHSTQNPSRRTATELPETLLPGKNRFRPTITVPILSLVSRDQLNKLRKGWTLGRNKGKASEAWPLPIRVSRPVPSSLRENRPIPNVSSPSVY